MKMGLSSRIQLPILLVISGCMAAFTLFTYLHSKTIIESKMRQQIQVNGDMLSKHVQQWLSDLQSQFIFSTLHEEFAELLLEPEEADTEEVHEILAGLKEGFGFYAMALLDETGMTRAATAKNKVGKADYSDREYFTISIAGEPHISRVLMSRTINKPAVVLSTPVRAEGRTIGVIWAGVNLGEFTDTFIDPIQIGELGYAYLIQSNGVYVAHPDKSKIMKEGIAKTGYGDRILAEKNGFIDHELDGRDQIAYLKEIPKTDWILVIQADRGEMLAEIVWYRNLSILVTVLLLCVVWGFGYIAIRSVIRPVDRISLELNDAAGSIAAVSDRLSSGSTYLSEGVSEQAASMEETSSALEEISGMSRQNAESVSRADQLMKDTEKTIERTHSTMSHLSGSMDKISDAGQKTSKIIKSIEEIAFQTNLLALNAAVEAARAGETGAGFAVVADEVRNLAVRASEAAGNTTALIQETIDTVAAGQALVHDVHEAFQEVSERSARVAALIHDLSAAFQEQHGGLEQINRAVSDMDQVVQQNAANARDWAAAGDALLQTGDRMNTIVDRLSHTLGLSGNSRPGRAEPSGLQIEYADANDEIPGSPRITDF